jgi:hypothetical protein
MRRKIFELLVAMSLLSVVLGVSFKSLYDRELKSSYGFEILKHYHSEPFGNEDVKNFKGESMLFMTPWYLFIHLGASKESTCH